MNNHPQIETHFEPSMPLADELTDTQKRIRAMEARIEERIGQAEARILEAVANRDAGLRSLVRALVQAAWSGLSQAYNEMRKVL